jgi:hypothetical protein
MVSIAHDYEFIQNMKIHEDLKSPIPADGLNNDNSDDLSKLDKPCHHQDAGNYFISTDVI